MEKINLIPEMLSETTLNVGKLRHNVLLIAQDGNKKLHTTCGMEFLGMGHGEELS
ncbi:hypothetical protein LC609_32105 [Nostoc sp. XA013]|nr:hypothetical protein [Nostoc sp. XA013]